MWGIANQGPLLLQHQLALGVFEGNVILRRGRSQVHLRGKVVEVGSQMVECSVRDTGRGVPAAAMPTLFEPFRRRQQSGDYAFSGSGLGLSICRKLVEAMGAELAVTTAQGEGTSFSFRLVLPPVTSEHSVFA